MSDDQLLTGTRTIAERYRTAVELGDLEALAGLYHPDALLDAHVPNWRFQVQGRHAIVENTGRLPGPGAFASFTAEPAADGDLLVEFEWRQQPVEGGAVMRELHLWRLDDGRIVEQLLYCAGIWNPDLQERIAFRPGRAEALPLPDATVDLVWCRNALYHVAAIDRAAAEFRRVLRPGGRVLVYQMFATDRLEPAEAAWLWRTMGVHPCSADAGQVERALTVGGLRVDDCVVFGTEFGEWAAERSGQSGRTLLHAARLLRAPDRYVAAFGRSAYDTKLGGCLWHVYGMIGKLCRRAYLLSAA
jgi:ketosteroid isomerase-like protein